VFDLSDDTEDLHRQYEILANLEEMRKKQRPSYVAKQVLHILKKQRKKGKKKKRRKKKHQTFVFHT
jgi:hypothetical protein